MSDATAIEWTDATWNPVRGCSRVSEGCRHCYAERVAARFSEPGQPFNGFAHKRRAYVEEERVEAFDPSARIRTDEEERERFAARVKTRPGWTGRVELIEEKLAEPLRWRKPRRVFVNSMSDLFHEALSDRAIAQVFGVMQSAPQHTFQVLTKRPERMRAWVEWFSTTWLDRGAYPAQYGHVWLGVSVEDQASADARIPHLLATPAAVRFVSYEPALGPVDFGQAVVGECRHEESHQEPETGARICRECDARAEDLGELDWLIVGGESGPGARPCDVAWIRSVLEQCRAARVPVFVKQLGSRPVHYPKREHVVEGGALDGLAFTSQTVYDPDVPADPIHLRDRKGGDPLEWPSDLRIRECPVAR